LGIGDWGLGPIPNPQSPIPKYNNYYNKNYNYFSIYFTIIINIIFVLYKEEV